jgi:hypothetical protein
MKTRITAIAAAALLLTTSLASAHSPGGIVRGGGITRGLGHPSFGPIRPGFGQIRPGFAGRSGYWPPGSGAYGYAGGGNVGAGIFGAILGLAAGAIGSRLTPPPVIVAPPVVVAAPPADAAPPDQAPLDRETWRKHILSDAAAFCDQYPDDVACAAKRQP